MLFTEPDKEKEKVEVLNHAKPESSDENTHSVKVFISYAHQDQELHEKLLKHLAPLQHSGKITIWHDQEIPAGANWRNQIETHLSEADMILLLISADFIDSAFCWNNEVQKALERHRVGEVRVIPIVLKPVDWQVTPLGELQALPTGAKPVTLWESADAACENVVLGIRKALEKESAFQKLVQKISARIRSVLPDREVTEKSQRDVWSRRLLLIGCFLLAVYCLDVGLSFFNLPLPSWVLSLVPYLGIPCVVLLCIEALQASTPVKARERRAFLGLSAVAFGFLTVGNFLQRKGQLTQLRIGITKGHLTSFDTRLFENALSDLLGVPVSSTFADTYEDTIHALGKGDVEIAWLGPFAYLQARQLYGARTIVCNTNMKGETVYYSYIVASAKANIHKLDDLKGKRFALADRSSTSGTLIPLYELKQAGFNLNTDIQTVPLGVNSVLDNILSEDFPAGAMSSDDYDNALTQKKFHQGDLKILQKSRPIPQGPFVARRDIQEYDKLRIEDALLTVADRDPSLVRTLNIGGFAKIEDNSYDFLLDIATYVGISISDFV